MNEYAKAFLTVGLSFCCGYALGWIQFGRQIRKETADRRRKFRDEICLIATRFYYVNPFTFSKLYAASIKDVREACILIEEDIKKRGKFRQCLSRYCSFNVARTMVKIDASSSCDVAAFNEYVKERQKECDSVAVNLQETLSELVKIAE